jgi:hypothetical protein
VVSEAARLDVLIAPPGQANDQVAMSVQMHGA